MMSTSRLMVPESLERRQELGDFFGASKKGRDLQAVRKGRTEPGMNQVQHLVLSF